MSLVTRLEEFLVSRFRPLDSANLWYQNGAGTLKPYFSFKILPNLLRINGSIFNSVIDSTSAMGSC